jgi:DNA replication protein DnaC
MNEKHIHDTVGLGEVIDAAPEGRKGPRIDLEEYGREYLRNELRKARRLYYEDRFPPEIRTPLDMSMVAPCNHEAVGRVINWQHGKRGLIITGETGLGKTRACAVLMRRLLVDELRDFRCYHATEFFTKMREFTKYGRDDIEPWLRDLSSYSGVFIDDYGQEALDASKEEWAKSWFFRFLDLMIGFGRPLIITTNLTSQDMLNPPASWDRGRIKAALRAEPLVRRLVDLCAPVKFVAP